MAVKADERAGDAAPADRRAWHDVARSWRAMANAIVKEDSVFGDEAEDGVVAPVRISPRRH